MGAAGRGPLPPGGSQLEGGWDESRVMGMAHHGPPSKVPSPAGKSMGRGPGHRPPLPRGARQGACGGIYGHLWFFPTAAGRAGVLGSAQKEDLPESARSLPPHLYKLGVPPPALPPRCPLPVRVRMA